MAITRLDCHIFRGPSTRSEASAFVALNPLIKPAQVVFAGSTAVVQGVGSQVAYRLAIDYFVQGVLDNISLLAESAGERGFADTGNEEGVVNILEAAFRVANSSVYNFGHKLAAGGRMAASLLGFVIDNGRFAAARVGQGSIYLFRGNQLFPFFSSEGIDRSVVGDIDEFGNTLPAQRNAFVGSHSIIDVDVASVVLEPGDLIAGFSRPLTSLNETLLFQHLEVLESQGIQARQNYGAAEQLCLDVFTQADTIAFGCLIALGPDGIYCTKRVT